MTIHTYLPGEQIPVPITLPHQCHGTKIMEIRSGSENLMECDGIWTKNRELSLGIKTSDCAPVCFYDGEKTGILHAGWRGLAGGICEEMLRHFTSPETTVFVGPMLHEFEIRKDYCYESLENKFGTKFFNEVHGKIIFHFKKALASVIPRAVFDPRSTFHDPALASWRRDRIKKRGNITVIQF